MNERGFAAAPISDQVEAIRLQDWRGRNPRQALEIAVRGFGARAEHDAADLRQAIDQEQPDAVVVDVNSSGALATACYARWSWARSRRRCSRRSTASAPRRACRPCATPTSCSARRH
jgi:hypothetical protein